MHTATLSGLGYDYQGRIKTSVALVLFRGVRRSQCWVVGFLSTEGQSQCAALPFPNSFEFVDLKTLCIGVILGTEIAQIGLNVFVTYKKHNSKNQVCRHLKTWFWSWQNFWVFRETQVQ